MKDKRPKNLNLFTIHFPVPAIVSILHRITGVILFLCIPFFLWVLQHSLSSQAHFDYIHSILITPVMKFIVWGGLSAYIYHLFAGVRHLLMDIHIGEELRSGRIFAMLTLFFSIVSIIGMGIWLW